MLLELPLLARLRIEPPLDDRISREQTLGRDRVQLAEFGWLYMQFIEEGERELVAAVPRLQVQAWTALDDCAMEESLRLWHREQRCDFSATARFAEHGDVARVATEIGDILLDPRQRMDDVQHPRVARAGVALAREIFEVQEPKDVQTMVDRHDD